MGNKENSNIDDNINNNLNDIKIIVIEELEN